VSGGEADLPACWHSCGSDDDDNIIVVVTIFAIADNRGTQRWRVGVLGVSGDGGVGTYLPSSPFLSSFPLLFLSLLLLGYPLVGARQCPGVSTTQGIAVGRPRSVAIEVGAGCPGGVDGRGWCGHDRTTLLLPLSPSLEFTIGRGRDWVAPEVQVRMHRGSPPACDRGAGRGGGVAWGGGLGRLCLGWGLGVG
jgi:hypothetical protein